MTSDRRQAILPFNAARLEPFLRSRQATVMSAELLSGGKCNSNYRVTLDDGLVCVARFHARGSAQDHARERYAMRRARSEAATPVPAVLYAGEGLTVLAFVEGRPLAAASDGYGDAARVLARIHASVRFEAPGWLEPDGTTTPFGFEGGGFLNSILMNAQVVGWLGPARVDAIRSIHENEAPRLAEMDRDVCLVHGDYNPTNILVQDGRVTAVLDWEFAHAGSPWMDLGNLLRLAPGDQIDSIQAGLIRGGMDLPGDWRARAALSDIGSALEFLSSTRSDAFKRTCIARIDAFIENFSS